MTGPSGVYIGTSGWSYPGGEGTWKGHFYPPGKLDELVYYSRFLDPVEVNSSFYAPLNPAYAQSWAKKTPDGFLFTVKLWQKFTHPKMYQEAAGEEAAISLDDVEVFNKGIEPLARYNKLGAILAQFPPSFKNDSYGRQILSAVINTFGKYNLAIELRHRSWSDDENTAKLMRNSNTAWVQIDEPEFGSSIARELPLTADMAYFRFHGRNRETWWTGDAETRYRYLYSPDEIVGLGEKVKIAAKMARLTFAFFNNHWQGYAPKNAGDLQKALGFPFAKELFNRQDITSTEDK